jgi:hypothetical protein
MVMTKTEMQIPDPEHCADQWKWEDRKAENGDRIEEKKVHQTLILLTNSFIYLIFFYLKLISHQ